MTTRAQWRIGVLGHGAIGSLVAAEIAARHIPGATLAGIIVRTPRRDAPAQQLSLDEALAECDLIVECAGQEALRDHGERILRAGVDLLMTSIGALADEHIEQTLRAAGPGRLFYTAGAIGGLDLLASGARMGSYRSVNVLTRKLPHTLIQPWMDPERVRHLEQAAEASEVFSGPAREAAKLFPKSLNVAAAVALAIQDWSAVTVTLIADPSAQLTEHRISARGISGEYSFTIKNAPAEQNPRTSAVVPYAVLRSLNSIISRSGGLI